ncbi:Glycogen debranching protein [Corynebacterium striatum]|uniref:hypothetical protein n=1 Tax=Corynebacterium striatum TaxID=43770 RepID=UPI000E03012C|nr:hypothetical protein [Corynebacterium striatum]STD37883.1 Glycogen debranching protein [Corynebacterium striatum]
MTTTITAPLSHQHRHFHPKFPNLDSGPDFEAITLAGLLPALARHRDFNGVTLTDQGFGDTPAGVQLSRELSMLFLHCDEYSTDPTGAASSSGPLAWVSHRTLGELSLSTRQAWDLAAANLQRRALTDQGLEFRTRRATELLPGCTEGVQVEALGAPTSSWLAHPQTFAILDQHLRRLIRAQKITYLVPDRRTVIALNDAPIERARYWSQKLSEQRRLRGAVLSPQPLVWANGFPLEV